MTDTPDETLQGMPEGRAEVEKEGAVEGALSRAARSAAHDAGVEVQPFAPVLVEADGNLVVPGQGSRRPEGHSRETEVLRTAGIVLAALLVGNPDGCPQGPPLGNGEGAPRQFEERCPLHRLTDPDEVTAFPGTEYASGRNVAAQAMTAPAGGGGPPRLPLPVSHFIGP